MSTHDELAHDLALCRARVGEIVRESVALGPYGHDGIADVVTLKPNWRGWPVIWEVKSSRADLLSDLRSGKWRKYLDFGGVIFATEAGICKRSEIPDPAGLWVRRPSGWGCAKVSLVVRRPHRAAESLRAMLLSDHPAPWRRASRPKRLLQAQAELAAAIQDRQNGERAEDLRELIAGYKDDAKIWERRALAAEAALAEAAS